MFQLIPKDNKLQRYEGKLVPKRHITTLANEKGTRVEVVPHTFWL